MKRIFFTLLMLCILIYANAQSQKKALKFNLDFERVKNNIPVGWSNFGGRDNAIYLDSTTVYSGKYSAVIEYKSGDQGFKSWSFALPDNYEGKQITLSGYIKTEDVTDGYAGLWMRIDPDIASDNMRQRGVINSTGWTKYEITLPLNPARTKLIVVGGILTGKGKMWLDNLQITIDGKDISEVKTVKKKTYPAEKDEAFADGSGVVFPALDEPLLNNLELLGKIWGFLKYHHPAIGEGKYNWDYELFRILPQYIKVKNNAERDKLLVSWIKKYGRVPACKTCTETPSYAFLKPGLSWVENSNMNDNLKKKINELYVNRHQGEHYYIELEKYVGNPKFSNENPYIDMPYPDVGFRLLSLYRYWNMIHYFFPNTYLTDKDWSTVLKEYIPLFVSANNELEYELAALQIIGEIQDTHANLWNGGDKIDSAKGKLYAPFRVQFIEQKVVVTDYYNPGLKAAAGLEIGDIITHINGKAVETIVDDWRKYYPASNEAARLRNMSSDLLRSNNPVMRIQYTSSGRPKQTELALYPKDSLDMYVWYKVNKDEKCYKLLDGNIGYITLATIKDEDIPVIKKEFRDTKGIIIDIRNYPSTFVPFSLGAYFISKTASFVKFTKGNPDNPGEFTYTLPVQIPKANKPYKGKLVVIVNEFSQSQAEYTAMAFRAGDNTTIVGSTTAGADGNISNISLPGGLFTSISGIGVYYPDGTQTQRIGIVPDIKAEPTINGIIQGKDEVLERAIEVILGE